MSSDRECNSEGERLHNTRQRAAELRTRSDNEQSQGEDIFQGADSCSEERVGGAGEEGGRASLAAAMAADAADKDTEDFADGISDLYNTNAEECEGPSHYDGGLECADASAPNRHPIPTDSRAEGNGDQATERRQRREDRCEASQPEDRRGQPDREGTRSGPTTSADAESKLLVDRDNYATVYIAGTVAPPASGMRENATTRGQTKRGGPSRRGRGTRRSSPLRLTHLGQEFSVAQPFRPRNQVRRDASPDDGMGETLFHTAPHRTDPTKRLVTEVIRQTKQAAHDRQQHGLNEARRLAMEGARKGLDRDYEMPRLAQSPAARNDRGSRKTPLAINSREQELAARYRAHPSQQSTASRVQPRDDSSADDDTDDDVWYDTGEQQNIEGHVDWDYERQEPIGDFDLAYASSPRCVWEHEMTVAMCARRGRELKDAYPHQTAGTTLSSDERVEEAVRIACPPSRLRKEAAITRLRGVTEHERSCPKKAGLTQGAEVKAPERFTQGLNRAIRQAKGETNRARGVSPDKETQRANDFWDKHYWSKRQTPGPGTKEGPECDPTKVRQQLYRMTDREDAFQDERDWGAARSRHPAGTTFQKTQIEPKRERQQLRNERGEGDASQRRLAESLSSAELAWLKKAAAGSSLNRLQQRCADRKTTEDAEKPEPDTYFDHERVPLQSSPVKDADTTLTTELIGYIEGQEKRMEKLEAQVRASRQSSPQRRAAEDPLVGARRFLQSRVATGREEERYASEIEQEVTRRPRRSVRIKEQMTADYSSDNTYGKPVEKEVKRRHKQKPQTSETKAARRKREFLEKVAAYEADSTGEETEGEVSSPPPTIQMRGSGPITKVKPPSFDGTMFLAFEQQFEAACRCSGYNEAARVELLRCSLKGPARQLLLNTGAESWTYAQLMEALRTRHGKTRSKTEIRNALREMYKKPGQKALDFADEIDWVASQAEFTPKELTTATYEAFWHGLRTTPRQQKYVEKHDATQTMKVAAEIAARWERTKGTTEDAYIPQLQPPYMSPPQTAYIPQPPPPVDWAIIQARQALNTGASMTGMHPTASIGQGPLIASAMSNEALLRQEEKDREDKRGGQKGNATTKGDTLVALQATLDDLSRDHAILKNSVYQERSQRNTNRGRGGFRFGQGRGGYNNQRGGAPRQDNGSGLPQDTREQQHHQGGPNQA